MTNFEKENAARDFFKELYYQEKKFKKDAKDIELFYSKLTSISIAYDKPNIQRGTSGPFDPMKNIDIFLDATSQLEEDKTLFKNLLRKVINNIAEIENENYRKYLFDRFIIHKKIFNQEIESESLVAFYENYFEKPCKTVKQLRLKNDTQVLIEVWQKNNPLKTKKDFLETHKIDRRTLNKYWVEKTPKERVGLWKQMNPQGNKTQCAKDLHIRKETVSFFYDDLV